MEAQETVQVPQEDRLALLETFAELISERWGYFTARRLTQKDANEKTKVERKTSTEAAKAVTESIEALIKSPNDANSKNVTSCRDVLKDARKVVANAKKPFNEKIKPLASIVKYCDSVAIPDSLKELGHPIVPQFKLSDWATKAVEQTKKRKD
jgi:molecular chaperone DnaK (HSP70)